MKKLLGILLLTTLVAAQPITISEREALDTGKRVWANECGGRIDGLTSWNSGEEFASLGIGHFIWYPKGFQGPFDESFPKLVEYLQQQKVAVPAWLAQASDCPWNSQTEFRADFNGSRMTELRQLLANTVAHQARFIAQRMQGALPKMLATLPESERAEIERRFNAVLKAPGGLYCLIDYVNFKGEGVKPSERYAGKGWGLLQVLQEMKLTGAKSTTAAFAQAAERVLTRRVENSPPERGERRWLTGWSNRVRGYAR